MPELDATHADFFLRGGVAALLVLHLVLLALHRARPAARAALAGFVASVIAYLFCQRPQTLLDLPRPLALALLVLCVASTAWLWVAARALFDDGFRFTAPVMAALAAMTALGLAANLPYLPPEGRQFLQLPAGSWVVGFGRAHALAMLGFAAAALWEVRRAWHDDLVETRRAARRWVALAIGVYAAVALAIELAVSGRAVGLALPALHVAGIGSIALALAVWVARHSLDDLLGVPAPAEAAAPTPAPAAPEDPALARLNAAMETERLYREDGLTLAELARRLGLGEAALRTLINQRLGFRNFNDFLHHHRLQEAAARLAAEDRPILTIALECGYGSIGPFNRAFKQRWGMTPSEYRGGQRLSGAVNAR